MEWVKLDSTFYLDAAVIRAGEPAEVLFVRAMAYCGDQENDGLVPRAILPRLAPTRSAARASALVREGLWEKVPEGWRFVNWARHQRTRDQLAADRGKAAARQARHRHGGSNAVGHAVTNASVTEQKREEEKRVDAAAAAWPPLLPESVEILRGHLEAKNLTVRWDRLTPLETREIAALVDMHGDAALVRSAMQSYRPDSPPAFASAWLAQWRALPPPGTKLHAVDTPACPEPGHSGTTNHCAQCASEAKAAR